MSRDLDPYWKIFAEEATSDLGISLTDEQVVGLTLALEGAHENYGLHSGRDVADANWRAAHDRETEKRGVEKVLRYIEDKVDEINRGPSRLFDAASHQQRLAMHELFAAREFIERKAT